MIEIWGIGDFNYEDAGLKKPIRYDLNDLKNIASETSTINITKEHSDEIIGELSNFIVEDGVLKAQEPEGLDLKGYGLSPVYDCELVDYGDYYHPEKIILTEIGLTKKPRNQIIYNSISEGHTMSESALEKVIREKDDLQKKIGVYEETEKQHKRLLKEKEEELKQIKESYSDVDKLKKENEILKEKAESYDKILSSRKSELISDIVGKDGDASEFEDFTIDQLEKVLKTRKLSSPRRGITPVDTPVDNGNDPVPTVPVEDDIYTDEMFEAEFKASGL